ncbi:uncharacterized protein BDV14DRAFT_199422 [Aspergillus stella-maris]|uniref:uncharacterized protein n=1 Tax=Aspergillus stella-maris TaxID=1810926 RepID=UPI003CCDD2F4
MRSTILPSIIIPALAGIALADSFNLYAYGDGIGGLPLHYADGAAVVSKGVPENATDTDVVSFTTSSGSLIGNPNATSTNPPFSDQLLSIPGPDSTSHEIGFVNGTGSPPADVVVNKFVWYGHTLLVENDEGEFTSLFSVRKSEGAEGEYSLFWNVTEAADDEGVITISMRSIGPSTG